MTEPRVESITTVATTPVLLDNLAIVEDKELWGSLVVLVLYIVACRDCSSPIGSL